MSSKPKIHRLGDLQLKIMKVLWERQEATVSEVVEALGRGSNLAYTTIATMLRKMEALGLAKAERPVRVLENDTGLEATWTEQQINTTRGSSRFIGVVPQVSQWRRGETA